MSHMFKGFFTWLQRAVNGNPGMTLMFVVFFTAMGFGLGWGAYQNSLKPATPSAPFSIPIRQTNEPTVIIAEPKEYSAVDEWQRLIAEPEASEILGKNPTCRAFDAYLDFKEIDRRLAQDQPSINTFETQTGVTASQVHERFVGAATEYVKILYHDELQHPPLSTCGRLHPIEHRGKMDILDLVASIVDEAELDTQAVLGIPMEQLRRDKANAIHYEIRRTLAGKNHWDYGREISAQIRLDGFTKRELKISGDQYRQFLNAWKQ